MYNYTAPPAAEPLPLKDLLRRLNISLTLRRKLKRTAGAIQVNGQAAAWQTVVRPGDTVSIAWPEECRIIPLAMPLDVVFEDESLLVADKPAGLLAHPTTDPARPSLANAVIGYLRARGLSCGVHPVHRLDRNTSGLILIAKNPHIHHLFSRPGGINIERTYLAIVDGIPAPPAGTIRAPIGRHPDSIIQRMVRADGQEAVTCYETVERLGSGSLVRLRLQTGRTHQIRVHLAHIGHPIFGDDLYGGSTACISRQALHAARLTFLHPLSGEALDLTSCLPPDMSGLLARLRSGKSQDFPQFVIP